MGVICIWETVFTLHLFEESDFLQDCWQASLCCSQTLGMRKHPAVQPVVHLPLSQLVGWSPTSLSLSLVLRLYLSTSSLSLQPTSPIFHYAFPLFLLLHISHSPTPSTFKCTWWQLQTAPYLYDNRSESTVQRPISKAGSILEAWLQTVTQTFSLPLHQFWDNRLMQKMPEKKMTEAINMLSLYFFA